MFVVVVDVTFFVVDLESVECFNDVVLFYFIVGADGESYLFSSPRVEQFGRHFRVEFPVWEVVFHFESGPQFVFSLCSYVVLFPSFVVEVVSCHAFVGSVCVLPSFAQRDCESLNMYGSFSPKEDSVSDVVVGRSPVFEVYVSCGVAYLFLSLFVDELVSSFNFQVSVWFPRCCCFDGPSVGGARVVACAVFAFQTYAKLLR